MQILCIFYANYGINYANLSNFAIFKEEVLLVKKVDDEFFSKVATRNFIHISINRKDKNSGSSRYFLCYMEMNLARIAIKWQKRAKFVKFSILDSIPLKN